MRRIQRLVVMAGSVLLCLTLPGCATGSANDAYGGSQPPALPTATCPSGICPTPALGGVSGVQVFVEPMAGETPVRHAIRSAQRTVWVEVYLLTDHAVIYALEDAAQRGVDVRVMLEANPYGSGATSPQQTLQELKASGVKAETANPAFHYTHEKAIIVDGAMLLVLTANLTKSGLGGSSYAENREYGVIDTAAKDVREAAAIFTADWQRTAPTVDDPNLVVSPVNARAMLAAFIASAHSTLIVEDEEMYDPATEDALVAAARRGVQVEVALPAPNGSTSGSDVARLVQSGVHVRYVSAVYMHAKMMVADGKLGFVGSENFSANSLDDNRELGILISGSSALAILQQTFTQDWSGAQSA
ncbi:MAG TPA: phospholipase D-like domain-containing protein [Ktedonobacterales bacterium]